jgi:DNA-nicking Smr family endonuclease
VKRRLGAEERALWEKVVASVRPLHPQAAPPSVPEDVPPDRLPQSPPRQKHKPSPPPQAALPAAPSNTLDKSWDRRLGRGLAQPEMTVDLHGHNLATAHSHLDARLQQAIEAGVRVLLLITGKPPQGAERPVARGAIRAAVGDWLAVSRHASRIAAVRNAHPRHGGAGALYIILRRPRS